MSSQSVSFEEGCAIEGVWFERCLQSTQSKALIHAFFGERTVAKIPGLPKDTPVADIRRAAVIGAGTMGGGIAMTYANAGIPVILKETTHEALDRGLATIRGNYARSVKSGRFSQSDADRRLALITPQLTYAGIDEADIIVEAVFESMELKKAVFREIGVLALNHLICGHIQPGKRIVRGDDRRGRGSMSRNICLRAAENWNATAFSRGL